MTDLASLAGNSVPQYCLTFCFPHFPVPRSWWETGPVQDHPPLWHMLFPVSLPLVGPRPMQAGPPSPLAYTMPRFPAPGDTRPGMPHLRMGTCAGPPTPVWTSPATPQPRPDPSVHPVPGDARLGDLSRLATDPVPYLRAVPPSAVAYPVTAPAQARHPDSVRETIKCKRHPELGIARPGKGISLQNPGNPVHRPGKPVSPLSEYLLESIDATLQNPVIRAPDLSTLGSTDPAATD